MVWSGIRGTYTEAAIIKMAMEYGFKNQTVEDILNLDYDTAKERTHMPYQDSYDVLIHDLDNYYDIADEAVNYLIKTIILPDGYYIGYSNYSNYFGIIKESEDTE